MEYMMSILRDEPIRTWFDLGLFIDRFKENKGDIASSFSGSHDDFMKSLSDGGIAFITFHYSIAGPSMEIEKYAKVFRSIIEDLPLHYIGGKFDEKSELLIPAGVKRFQLDELASFDDWPLYEYFFFQKLERGNRIYNDLILKLWSEVLIITEKLGHYIEHNNIKLLYLINTNSNPGNISLALALVFISELLGIPVLNNNHDFYWEGGHSEIDIQIKGVKPGPRDHFFKNYHLGEVFSIIEMIYPWESRTWLSVNINEIQCERLINEHGQNPANITQIGTAIENRHNASVLKKEFERILFRLYLQITSGTESYQLAKDALKEYKKHIKENKGFTQNILSTKNRQYLPGYGQMAYMLLLKSLIDPSYFRVEEKRFRGMAMQFAKELVDNNPDPTPLSQEAIHLFYNSVDSIFLYRDGEITIQMDHSFAYRHRNKNNYPYRDLTLQELTGVISILFNKIASPPAAIKIEKYQEISNVWNKNLSLLYKNSELAIDHTDELERKLNTNIPIALFLGNQIELELELFVLSPVRKRLGLEEEDKITPHSLDGANLAPIYIIARNKPLGESVTADVLKSYIKYDSHLELRLLLEHRVCNIVGSEQHSVGFHSYGVGQEVGKVLTQVKKEKGIIIAIGDDAAIMTDIVDLDRFHIGIVSDTLTSKMMGIPYGSSYIQWVPPGLRFVLSFPTPVQTGKDFSKALKSFQYKNLCDSLGEDEVLQLLKKDAEEKGTPIKTVLRNLDQPTHQKSEVSHSHINGLYSDGLPWAGVNAKINLRHSNIKWQFSVMSTADRPKTVLNFVEEFNKTTGRNAKVAWNGGYILNPELVGKLGIPEKFIGSPLGLVISNKKVLSPPLFNKSAFIVLPDGAVKIKRVNSSNGITISDSSNRIVFPPDTYNPKHKLNTPCFYDLLFPDDKLEGNGRILVRLSGHTIIDIIQTTENEMVPVLPVGLTLSFPKDQFPKTWEMGKELNIKMNGWEEIDSAIEAGPQLLKEGEVCIDMDLEGWKTQNSIKTQAARLDYLDSRGPKIAVGIDKTGDLSVLTINGRIRESVGATHGDMADILKTQGMDYAMGFDPGGSSTLVVDNKVLNISPYNSEYEKDVYSLPPEPRAIANALIVSET
jgi:hypothetical protein